MSEEQVGTRKTWFVSESMTYSSKTRTITSAEVAEIFWKKIVCNYGLPLSIVSDNDILFTSELWTNLMNEAKVKLKTTAPARPQADGQTERTNRVIKEMLSKMTNNRL
ncbi:hypothetical protein ACTFIU_000097 [Dictyostelium citrinum]